MHMRFRGRPRFGEYEMSQVTDERLLELRDQAYNGWVDNWTGDTHDEIAKAIDQLLRLRSAPSPLDERMRAILKRVLALDTPWPLRDVLDKLRDATNHLLGYHSCDTHGHEGYQTASGVVALELLSRIDEATRALSPQEPAAGERDGGYEDRGLRGLLARSRIPGKPNTYFLKPGDIDAFLAPVAPLLAAQKDGLDAARYRHLRKYAQPQWRNGPGLYWYLPHGMDKDTPAEQLDENIDAAIQLAGKGDL